MKCERCKKRKATTFSKVTVSLHEVLYYAECCHCNPFDVPAKNEVYMSEIEWLRDKLREAL